MQQLASRTLERPCVSANVMASSRETKQQFWNYRGKSICRKHMLVLFSERDTIKLRETPKALDSPSHSGNTFVMARVMTSGTVKAIRDVCVQNKQWTIRSQVLRCISTWFYIRYGCSSSTRCWWGSLPLKCYLYNLTKGERALRYSQAHVRACCRGKGRFDRSETCGTDSSVWFI